MSNFSVIKCASEKCVPVEFIFNGYSLTIFFYIERPVACGRVTGTGGTVMAKDMIKTKSWGLNTLP